MLTLLFLNTCFSLFFFSFKLIHLEQYQVHSKLGGKCRELPVPCPHTCTASPTTDILQHRGTIEPELAYHYHTTPSFN